MAVEWHSFGTKIDDLEWITRDFLATARISCFNSALKPPSGSRPGASDSLTSLSRGINSLLTHLPSN